MLNLINFKDDNNIKHINYSVLGRCGYMPRGSFVVVRSFPLPAAPAALSNERTNENRDESNSSQSHHSVTVNLLKDSDDEEEGLKSFFILLLLLLLLLRFGGHTKSAEQQKHRITRWMKKSSR